MDRFEGLPPALATALGEVPVEDKAQLELGVRLPHLSGAAARVAERLRVRVLTWDPLGWCDDGEPAPYVAVEGSGSGYAITLFVGAWNLDAPLLDTVAAEIGALVDSVVRVGAVNEASLISGEWTELEDEGLVPPLLGALRLDVGLPPAELGLLRDWWPIDVETVATIVSAAFGPLDLDLTPRALSAATNPAPGCPACAGGRYSVPFEIDLARPAMCGPHRAEALALMARAVHKVEDDNPEGWEAFAHAAADLLPGPHVPYPIRNRLLDAEDGLTIGNVDESLLQEQAEALVEYARWAGTPDLHMSAMWDLGWRPEAGPSSYDSRLDDFAHQVAYSLGAGGRFELAAEVVDAVAPILPDSAANLHGELSTHLAEDGRIEEARARLEQALADPSADLLTQIYAGEVEEAAGDVAAAEARYRAALTEARKTKDSIFEHDILWHLVELIEDDESRAGDLIKLERERDRVHARSAARAPSPPTETFGRKVGRNEPCPCGSGRKYKRCHGGAG